MADTTITLTDEAKGRLEAFRHAGHGSWSDTITGITKSLPSPDEIIEEGCTYSDCEKPVSPPPNSPIEEIGGVVHSAMIEAGDTAHYYSKWFCTAECAQSHQEEIDRMAGVVHGKIVVGGRRRTRFETDAASFERDGGEDFIEIDIPAPFGEEWVGEPVYVYHLDEDWGVVYSGVVGGIVQGERYTMFSLERSNPVEYANHPEDGEMESFADHARFVECRHCEREVPAFSDDGESCPSCGESDWLFDDPSG